MLPCYKGAFIIDKGGKIRLGLDLFYEYFFV